MRQETITLELIGHQFKQLKQDLQTAVFEVRRHGFFPQETLRTLLRRTNDLEEMFHERLAVAERKLEKIKNKQQEEK